MAAPNLSEALTASLEEFSPELADNVSRNIVLLNRLKRRGNMRTFGGGVSIRQDLEYQNNQTYTRYSGWQTINTAPNEIMTAATFPLRQIAVAVSISGLEQLQNMGRAARHDLLKARLKNARRSMMSGLDFDLHSAGTESGQINGLAALISTTPSSGTVGNINRALWAFWQNAAFSCVTDGGAAMTSANVQNYFNRMMFRNNLIRNTDGTDTILAGATVYQAYAESLQAIQRITDEEDGKLGFTSLKYSGAGRTIDVVLDAGFQGVSGDFGSASGQPGVGGLTTTTAYFLNTDYLHFRPHAERNMVPIGGDRMATNQDGIVRLIGWAGNLTVSNMFLQGVMTA